MLVKSSPTRLPLRPSLNRSTPALRNQATKTEAPQQTAPPTDQAFLAGQSLPKTLESSPVPNVPGSFAVSNPELGAIVCTSPEALQERARQMSARGITLIAVRHGESESNKAEVLSGQEETPLNSKGREQAREAARAILANHDFSPQDLVIFTSPLSRAEDTALALKELVPQAELHRRPELAEINFGICEGRAIPEVIDAYPNFASGHDFAHRFPGGESGLDVMGRFNSFLKEVEENYPNKTVVYFAHSMTVGMGGLLLGKSGVKGDGSVRFDRKVPNAVPEVLVQARKSPDELGPLFAK